MEKEQIVLDFYSKYTLTWNFAEYYKRFLEQEI